MAGSGDDRAWLPAMTKPLSDLTAAVSDRTEIGPALLLAGMHRSGTSALARVISLLGAELPRTLMRPGQDNPKGYWESDAVAALNDELLGEIGAVWDDPLVFLTRREELGTRPATLSRIGRVVRAEYALRGPTVIKDPRMALVLAAWLAAAARERLAPRVIVPFRDPLEVAASLNARNGFSYGRSLLLWLSYNLSAEKSSRGSPRVFAHYGELLLDWRSVLRGVEERLDVRLPRWAPAAEIEVDAFLSRTDRHHVSPPGLLHTRADVANWVKQVYELMLGAAAGEAPDTSVLDEIAAEFAASTRVFAPVIAEQAAALSAARAVAAKVLEEKSAADRTLERLEREKRELEARRDVLASDVEINRTRADALEQESLERAAQADALRARAGKLEAEIAEREAQLKEAQGREEALESKLRERDVQIADLQGQLLAELASLDRAKCAATARMEELERTSHDRIASLEASLSDAIHRSEQAAIQLTRLDKVVQAQRDFLAKSAPFARRLRRALWQYAPLQPLSDILAFHGLARSRGVAAAARAVRQARALRASRAVDVEFYLSENWDVAAAGQDPVVHYVANGAAEGRDPSPSFSTRAYLERHPDVAKAGANPLHHYVRHGRREGRAVLPPGDALQRKRKVLDRSVTDAWRPGAPSVEPMGRSSRFMPFDVLDAVEAIRTSGLFDAEWYRAQYPQCQVAGLDPIQHYLRFAAIEGLNPHPLFDRAYYADSSADVLPPGVDPFIHYLCRGSYEVRSPHPLFNSAWYLRVHGLEPGSVEPLQHYLNSGCEACGAHPYFDERYYLKQHPEVKVKGVNALLHYLNEGARRRFDPNPFFHTTGYLFDNPDVGSFGGNALRHYVLVGRERPARPHPLFDAEWYLHKYDDVAASGADPYAHYLHEGRSDGRAPSAAVDEGVDPLAHSLCFTRGEGDEHVTIIVPAYRNFANTYRCLYALSRRTPMSGVRVILADDCPEHPLAPLLQDTVGLEILARDRNLGFLRNCNDASRHASGDFVVFLNNDTVVAPRWLEPLVEVATGDPRVGMVGCKLLNEDGTIQEAGGVMFQDGWGYPYGRGEGAGECQYNFVRQVDCVIGAAFLVRRSAFEEVGRFDERYAPAFFEEFDLAFALQQAGYKILYQPASEVFHRGSASYGADARDQLSNRNHKKFVQKWEERLRAQHADARDIFIARVRGRPSGHILVIDDMVPEHDKHAGAVTISQHLRLLTELGFQVHFLPHDGRRIEPYTSALQQMGMEVLYETDAAEWLERNGRHIEWVWSARPDVTSHYIALVRRHTRARLIYYTHDLHCLRELRRYQIEGDANALLESQRIERIERDIFRRVDCVTAPSEAEAEIIRRMEANVEVAVLTPYFFRPAPFRAKEGLPIEARRSIIFVGGFDHAPNVDAAIQLVRSIMPAVWRETPDARVMLVGSNPPPQVVALGGRRVEVTGHVPDIAPYFARARMSVCPLRYGAGVKGKIVASLEAGVPVVTTAVGAEGIGLSHGRDALVANEPSEIAAQIARLFREPQLLHQLREAGLKLIASEFSEERARARLLAALQCYCDRPRADRD